MPTIPTLADVKKKYGTGKKERKFCVKSDIAGKFYNSTAWKNTRTAYMKMHPICELSLLHENVVEAEHVHHIVKFNEQSDDSVKMMLLTDTDNLISVCEDKHLDIHYRRDRLSKDELNWLENKKKFLFSKYINKGIIINITSDSNIQV